VLHGPQSYEKRKAQRLKAKSKKKNIKHAAGAFRFSAFSLALYALRFLSFLLVF
jgi:hypothetical protein